MNKKRFGTYFAVLSFSAAMPGHAEDDDIRITPGLSVDFVDGNGVIIAGVSFGMGF